MGDSNKFKRLRIFKIIILILQASAKKVSWYVKVCSLIIPPYLDRNSHRLLPIPLIIKH